MADDPAIVPIRTLEVVAGSQRVRVDVNTSGAPAVVALDGSEVDGVEIRVLAAATAERGARVGLREVAVDGLRPDRTLVVPGTVPASAAWAFSTTPGRRACFVVFGTPDCDVARIRGSEEKAGLDRTFTLEGAQQVTLTGHVVARSTVEAARLLDPVEHRPPVTASSTYGQDPRVAARFAYDGQPSTSWVSDDRDLYPTLTFRWKELRTVSAITVASGVQAPASAVVTANGSTQRVALTGDTAVALRPVQTRRLLVRFEKAPGAARVVVPEVTLTGVDVTRPLLSETPTGALCGFGPVLYVDGLEVATRVTGTMADVINGSPLAFEACDKGTGELLGLDLGQGEHRLHANPTAEFEVIDLLAHEDAAPPYPSHRPVTVERWGGAQRTVEVGAGEETLLSVAENFNAGWVAEVDGEQLTPLRVDGWQQGWLLPAGDQVTVELRYRPQATYDVVLPFGLVVSGALLLGALVIGLARLVARLRGRRPTRTGPDVPWPAAQRLDGVGWAFMTGAVLLLLGPVATLGLVAGAFGGRWLLRMVLAGGGLVALSGLLDALGRPEAFETPADVVAALGVGLLVGLVLGLPRRRPMDPVRDGTPA